jgi:hypothetical protein
MDMAMTLSEPHPADPFNKAGVKLGDYQFDKAGDWERKGLLALVGIGVEPGMVDVFARYAQDHLFDEIEELGVRDGANLEIEGYEFAPNFSIWTTIEECLNPPVIWEKDKGLVHDRAVLRAGSVRIPGGDRQNRSGQRGTRGSAAHAALDQGEARHLQVWARRPVHRCVEDPQDAGVSTTRKRSMSKACRSLRVMWSPPACLTPPTSATG